MIKKKQIFNVFITGAIIFTMVFSSISAAVADNLLSDIKGHWAQDTIEDLVDRRIIEGYPDGTFRPNNNITRAEFTSLLVRAFDLKSDSGKVFSDTAGHWAKDYIKTANYHGLVNGYSDALFGPDDPVTREQIAAMVVNATKVESVDESKTFIDSDQISVWAKEPVAKAAAAGLITGYPDGTFKPKANATRAEAAVILDRSMKITTDKKNDAEKIPDPYIENPPEKEGGPSTGGGSVSPGKTGINTVSIAGAPVIGQTLTATVKPSGATVDYQWQRASEAGGTYEDVDGATGETYKLVAGDVGQYIRVVAVGKDDYKGEITSNPVGPIKKTEVPGVTVTLAIDPIEAKIGDEIALSGNAGPGILISIKVVDSSGEIVYFDGTKSGSDGKYNTTFIVPDSIDGDLAIVAGYGENVATRVLEIIE